MNRRDDYTFGNLLQERFEALDAEIKHELIAGACAIPLIILCMWLLML